MLVLSIVGMQSAAPLVGCRGGPPSRAHHLPSEPAAARQPARARGGAERRSGGNRGRARRHVRDRRGERRLRQDARRARVRDHRARRRGRDTSAVPDPRRGRTAGRSDGPAAAAGSAYRRGGAGAFDPDRARRRLAHRRHRLGRSGMDDTRRRDGHDRGLPRRHRGAPLGGGARGSARDRRARPRRGRDAPTARRTSSSPCCRTSCARRSTRCSAGCTSCAARGSPRRDGRRVRSTRSSATSGRRRRSSTICSTSRASPRASSSSSSAASTSPRWWRARSSRCGRSAAAQGSAARARRSADECLEVDGDVARLQQVIGNVLHNAIKFTPRDGRIGVRLARARRARRRSRSRTAVRASSPSSLPHVFDRFVQSESSTTRRHGGLGLGLAIVQQLTALHGGTVRAESAGPGRGARFTIALPLAASALEREHGRRARRRSRPPRPPTSRRSTWSWSTTTSTRARPWGSRSPRAARWSASPSPRGKRSPLRRRPPAVLVSDIGMPGEDGYALIRAIRTREEGTHAAARSRSR